MTLGSKVSAFDEIENIVGYNFDSPDKRTITIGAEDNVINIYYTKRDDLEYTVNYFEKATGKRIHDQVIKDSATYESVIKAQDEKIDIDGYVYDSADKNSISIKVEGNAISLYYVKRADLSYKVSYVEKGTGTVIHDAKTVGMVTYETEIKAENEVIDINGYSYDSADKTTIKVGTGTNEITLYYTKVTGLSYTVNYLEKGTNNVIKPAKTVGEQKYGNVITVADEVIAIDGYNYASADKEKVVIGTDANIVNIYYTKRNDLGYTVNYLERDTGKVLQNAKVQNGKTLGDTIHAQDEVIDIDGYTFDSIDKGTLTIETGSNTINIYYVKRNDLSYKVNYLEKGTGKVLHEVKVQSGMTFKEIVAAWRGCKNRRLPAT